MTITLVRSDQMKTYQLFITLSTSSSKCTSYEFIYWQKSHTPPLNTPPPSAHHLPHPSISTF